jgi:hypothetical protein
MSRHIAGCYNWGKIQEKKVYPIIEEYFDGENIIHSANQYDKYDFVGNTKVFELKSRRNRHNSYLTTMITCNKLKKLDKELILLFNFTDGLYFIKYDDNLFKTFFSQPFKRDEVNAYPLDHVYIPIEHLTLIKKY